GAGGAGGNEGGAGGTMAAGGAGGEGSGGEPPVIEMDGGLFVDAGSDAGGDAGEEELDSGLDAEEVDSGTADAGSEPEREPEPDPDPPWELTLECALPQGGESVNPFNLSFYLTNDDATSLDLTLVEIHYFLNGDGNTGNTIVEYYDESGEATVDTVDTGAEP